MANLASVQLALKQGDKVKAQKLLKQVLKQSPSADAWYLAARLTDNEEMAQKYLKRAINMNPNHVKAQDMLRQLGGEYKGVSHGLLEEIRIGLEDFGQNYPVLRNLEPRQRMFISSGLFVVIFLVIAGLLISSIPKPPPEQLPLPEVVHIQADTVPDHFSASGLSITAIENISPEAGAAYQQQFKLTVDDAATPREVNVYVYAKIANLVNDQERLAAATADNNVVIYETSAMIYPKDLSSDVGTTLENTLRSLPANS